ncbi:MAG TPA: DUF2939 domain-containing protein [Candidatus Binataceae bacterium]|nr:DUF2939 domain-containing protein [Candidatus Binataceae bacterium]
MRFALKHWTSILVAAVVAWWALFYVPGTPSYALVQLKRAIDAQDGSTAIRYIDFDSVVSHAGDEMMQKNGNDPLGQLLGRGALQLFSKPMANLAKAWTQKKIDDGDPNLKIPGPAIAGAIVMMNRNGDTASTSFRDKKGREYEIKLSRDPNQGWRVTEVKNARQILEQIQPNGGGANPLSPPPDTGEPSGPGEPNGAPSPSAGEV